MGIFDKIFHKNEKHLSAQPSNVEVYNIVPPSIPSGEVYHFTTGSGIEYEVRLGKIKDSLGRVINFNVLNDEYEDDEYAATNKGEIYKVVATVLEIMKMYMNTHPLIRTYEFTGEFKDENREKETSIRTRFFVRALIRTFPNSKVKIIGNRGIITIK